MSERLHAKSVSGRLFEIGKGLPDFIKWAFWVVAFLAVGALLFVSLTEHTTAIEPISVPKTLADQGYTSDIAACRLRDALNKFAAHALKRYKVPVLDPQLNTKIALDGEVPNIIVPTTGLSLNTISTSIRSFLGSGRRRSISGEFFLKNGLLRLRLRLDGNVLYDSPGADPESPDKLLALAAPRIFKALQPYVLVSAEENPQKALEIANEIIARLPERDENVVWSYILKGDIQRKLGKYAEAVESLKKAIDLAPQLAVPHLFLGFCP